MKQKILFFILILCIIFSTGCSSTQKALPKKEIKNIDKVNTTGYIVTKPVLKAKKEKASYVYSLPITQTSKDIIVEGVNCNITQIAGMKDSELENKINTQISVDLKSSLYNLEKISSEKADYANASIYPYYNNLMSVSISAGYHSYIQGFLYDLTSGKKITLDMLFTKGTDYVSLLNRKIIENILSSNFDEEELLFAPFTTISKDQSFFLLPGELVLIFKKGEANFNTYYSVRIPLIELDDYIDILEKKSNDSSIYKDQKNINKYNNNYILEKNEAVDTPNGELEINYTSIADKNYPDLEKNIEKLIRTKINETITLPIVQTKDTNSQNESLGSINMYVSFNCYDYICFSRYINIYREGFENLDYSQSFVIDRKTGKEVDIKDFLINYVEKKPENKEIFVKTLKEKLSPNMLQLPSEEIAKIDFQYILDNCHMFFNSYGFESKICLSLLLKDPQNGGIMANIEFQIYEDLKIPPEEFFKLGDN